jgi:hypothetical protein
LPNESNVSCAENVAGLTNRDPMQSIEEARAIRPGANRDGYLGPVCSAISRVIEGVTADHPTLESVKELDHLKVVFSQRDPLPSQSKLPLFAVA